MQHREVVRKYIGRGHYGLEKESLRVGLDGFMAQTLHPFPDNPNIERDFCENQAEFITDVWDSLEAAWNQLKELQQQAVRLLKKQNSGEELLWPFSNPPYLRSIEEIPIARYQGEQQEKTEYRKYLAKKYGKKKMLYSGIHFNFSFPEEMFQSLFQLGTFSTYQECKNYIYLDLAKKVMKYDWLLVYLMASSPVMDSSFQDEKNPGGDVTPEFASYRCGEKGYWNTFVPVLDYESLDSYTQSIQTYVVEGKLKEAKELYYPVRVKPLGENSLENLRQTGIDHIELRMLDLNPLSPVGIEKKDLEFLQMFLYYLTGKEEIAFPEQAQRQALRNAKRAAEYEDEFIWIETGEHTSVPIKELALSLLTDMERYYRRLGEWTGIENIQFQETKILCPQKRYAVQVQSRYGHDFVQKGISLAKRYQKELGEEETVYV